MKLSEKTKLRNRAILIIELLRKNTQHMTKPAASTIVEKYGKNPFLILVSCLLSLRTKDTISLPASLELFAYAQKPQQLLALSDKKLESIIYSTGFYRQKAAQLKHVSKELIERFDSKVPCTQEELLSLKGVGRKTANLVLGQAFDIPAICVDVHVHRISNRLGLVETKTPYETESALQEILPKKYWIEFNTLLVVWGQNICVPVSPLCSKCVLFDVCPKIGVKKHR